MAEWLSSVTDDHLPVTTTGSSPLRADSFTRQSFPSSLQIVSGFTQVPHKYSSNMKAKICHMTLIVECYVKSKPLIGLDVTFVV